MKWNRKHAAQGLLLGLAALALAGCELRQAMYDGGRFKPYEKSDFFADGRTARPLVEGTIARGYLRDDDLLHRGRQGDALATVFPFRITEEDMEKGRTAYTIYCSVCHGHVGTGNGMIVQRGYKQPPSFHEERLRGSPNGYFYEVITNGFGVMPGYAAQVEPEERWRIVAYLRALQYSQNAEVGALPEEDRAKVMSSKEEP